MNAERTIKIALEEITAGLLLKQRAIMMDRVMFEYGQEVPFVIDFCIKCEIYPVERQQEIKDLFLAIMNNPPQG